MKNLRQFYIRKRRAWGRWGPHPVFRGLKAIRKYFYDLKDFVI